MEQHSDTKGRTFWDYLHDHPHISFTTIAVLILILIFLIWNRWSISFAGATVKPPESIQPKKDTTKKSSPNEANTNLLDTNVVMTNPTKNTPHTKHPKKELYIKQPGKDTVKTQIVNVTSNDQKGGITANQVNIGQMPRSLDQNLSTQLINFIPNKNEPVDITSLLGDGESFQFASSIKSFLISKGYTKVNGVNQGVFSAPVKGQFLNRDSTGVKILIGSL